MEPLTAKKAKELLEPIPHDEWCTGDYVKVYKNSNLKCCFFGHLIKKALEEKGINVASEEFIRYNISSNTLLELDRNITNVIDNDFRNATSKFLVTKHKLREGINAATINNDPIFNGYTEPEIKDRMMHFLDDMIEWEKEQENVVTT